MENFLNNLFNTTPKQWFNKIVSLIRRQENIKVNNQWHKIKTGYGKGVELFLDPSIFRGWENMICGEYDKVLYEELLKICKIKNKIIWDVGAHFGYHTLIFSKLVSEKGKVLAFEPNYINLERLKLNIDRNTQLPSNIKVFSYALSDKKGKAKFIYSDNIDNSQSTGSHLDDFMLPQTNELYKKLNFKKTEVDITTADELVNKNELIIPDILKIDIEGAEYKFLIGAENLIKKYSPIILMEVHNIVAMFKVQNFLKSFQYNIKLIDEANSSTSRCFIIAYKE